MKASHLKAVAWDIDGTLVDSEPLHLRALIAVSKRYDLDLSGEPDARFRGVHMSNVWRALAGQYPDDLTEEAWNGEIMEWYVAHAEGLEAMPGALETVKTLAERGIAQICVSNSSRKIVDTNIRTLGIAPHLVGSVSFSDVKRGKPDPEPYVHAVSALGVARETVLAVEDSATGALSGRRGGLNVAFYRPEPDAPHFAEADIEITDLRQLLDLPALAG